MNNENDNESAYKNAFFSSLAYGACALYNRTVIYLGTARLTLTGRTSLKFQIKDLNDVAFHRMTSTLFHHVDRMLLPFVRKVIQN